MNVRAIQVRSEAAGIRLRLEAGHATVPVVSTYDLDPATALALAGALESAVHKTATAGLPLFATPENLTPENLKTRP